MRNRVQILLGCLLVAAMRVLGQHQPMYSHYMFQPLGINPAYAGSRSCLSISALYRHQWVGIQGAPRTTALFAHSPLRDSRSNLGLGITYDQLGVTSTSNLQLVYAFRIPMGKARLSMGLQGGMRLIQNRNGQVITDSPDAIFQGANSIIQPTAGAGAYFDTPRFYAGFSVPQLLAFGNPALGTANATGPLGISTAMLSLGGIIRLNPDLLLRPSILLKAAPNSPPQADMGLQLSLKEIVWVGAGLRSSDALSFLLEWNVVPQFRLGYAYDYPISPLRQVTSGSHEVFLRYEFGYKFNAMSPRYF